MSVETPETLIALAGRARQAGQVEAAIDAYERLLAMRPDLPDSWFNLATMQRRAGRYQDALASYRQALDRGVSGPEEVHLNRGVILAEDLADTDAAEAELKAALAIAPDYLPALLNLGNLHEDRGEREAARAAYERALAVDPDHALALARLAGASRVEGANDPLIGLLGAALARPGRSAADLSELGFALGRALDQVGDHDAAFAAYGRANRDSRASGPPGLSYDQAAQEALIDRIIAAFPAPVASVSTDGAAPIFILGMFRSGSTLAEQILGAHSRVTVGGELPLLPRLVAGLANYPDSLVDASSQAVAGWRAAYLDGLAAMRPGADVITDKRPDNFLHIGLIKTLFPNARIVHTVRDPLDTCLSIHFLHLDHSMTYALDLEDTAHWFGQYRRVMAHWKALYPEDIHDLDYDALVAEPRPVVEDLLAFCALDWEDGVLSFHAARNPVRTASVWQVREPLYQRASGRAAHYASHLEGLQRSLARLSDVASSR